jgi:hypothetical protein
MRAVPFNAPWVQLRALENYGRDLLAGGRLRGDGLANRLRGGWSGKLVKGRYRQIKHSA